MFTLSPGDNPVQNSKSDTTVGNFGGNRQHSNVASSEDYTKRTGSNSNMQENPIDSTTKDIDDLADDKARKNEFSHQENKNNQQDNNKPVGIQSDSDNKPVMDAGSDAVQSPEASTTKRHRKPNQWNFGTDSTYDN